MKRFYVFRDGTMEGSAASRVATLDMIRQLQKRETHPFLRSSFSMIEGEEEFIPYPSMKKEKAKNQKERGEAR